MAQYYIKKLGRQEMGSPDAEGRTQRGRYIYLSKESGDFFPYLSQTVYNDILVLPIIMPEVSDTKMYAKFVYNNSKHFPDRVLKGDKTPRDEYRLYLNNEIDHNKTLFRPAEIIVIEKIEEPATDAASMSYIYSINLFKPSDPNYAALDAIIAEHRIGGKGNNAIFNGELDFVPRPNLTEDLGVSISRDIVNVVKEEQRDLLSAIEDENSVAETIEDIRGANLFTSVSFRDFVLFAYDYKCAITGKSIRYKNLNNLEAAHIQPRAHAGTYLPCNGLALCRDMHWAFDKGFITITDEYTVMVHDEMKGTMLSEIDGKRISVPDDPYFQPEKKFLKHHRENIFGLFVHSGVIRSN